MKQCINCGLDISDNLVEEDPSKVSGFIDIFYYCPKCKIKFYPFKVQYLSKKEIKDLIEEKK